MYNQRSRRRRRQNIMVQVLLKIVKKILLDQLMYYEKHTLDSSFWEIILLGFKIDQLITNKVTKHLTMSSYDKLKLWWFPPFFITHYSLLWFIVLLSMICHNLKTILLCSQKRTPLILFIDQAFEILLGNVQKYFSRIIKQFTHFLNLNLIENSLVQF